MVEHSFSWCYLIEIRPWKKVFWKCYQSNAFGLCLNIISEKINKNVFALIVSDRGIWRWLFCYVLSPTSCKTVIYFVTMVGNVPWSKADNTPWSHTTVTPLPTMFKHGRQWKTMHGTMVNLLPGKEEKRGKAMVALLFFIMATLDAKDPFGGNVLKYPARYIFHCYGCTLRIVYHYANPLTAVFSHGCLQAGSIFGQK